MEHDSDRIGFSKSNLQHFYLQEKSAISHLNFHITNYIKKWILTSAFFLFQFNSIQILFLCIPRSGYFQYIRNMNILCHISERTQKMLNIEKSLLHSHFLVSSTKVFISFLLHVLLSFRRNIIEMRIFLRIVIEQSDFSSCNEFLSISENDWKSGWVSSVCQPERRSYDIMALTPNSFISFMC